MTKFSIFWFRRDLRLDDNIGLLTALVETENVLPIFIFDPAILSELQIDDPRVNFIYNQLKSINQKLNKQGSSVLIRHGSINEVWLKLLEEFNIEAVYTNRDYEPYAEQRDEAIQKLLASKNITFKTYKDQVVHEKSEVMKGDGSPYTIYTPFKNKWLSLYKRQRPTKLENFDHFLKNIEPFPTLSDLGLKPSTILVKDFSLKELHSYGESRNIPSLDSTSYLGPHLRFGTVSPRQIIDKLGDDDAVFLSELIWREFFMQILYHFPQVVYQCFKPKYESIKWLNNTEDFDKWCKGETGYPMVDAGMRQLNETGYMHNRVRMITAGFLCKHLLIDWRWGEAYFANKLLDYDLASNNGNWQWAAGTGCDAAPYFRIFNPIEQLKKFDKNEAYVRKWIPEIKTGNYCHPMVDHKFARARALDKYKSEITF